jgi:hypothetical protein
MKISTFFVRCFVPLFFVLFFFFVVSTVLGKSWTFVVQPFSFYFCSHMLLEFCLLLLGIEMKFDGWKQKILRNKKTFDSGNQKQLIGRWK